MHSNFDIILTNGLPPYPLLHTIFFVPEFLISSHQATMAYTMVKFHSSIFSYYK
jgi:hypothetical protein